MRKRAITVWLLLFVAAVGQAQEPKAPLAKIDLQDGDTLVFLGDSITHQCLYTQYVEDFFYTRYPQAKIRFHNSGVGGDRAADALARFDDDVAAFKPKYVTILLGMNDGSYTRFEQPIFDTYERDMTTLLDRINEIGAQAVPMTPTMFDSRAALAKSGAQNELRNRYYNGVLAFYGAWLREQTLDRGLGYVDMYSPLNNITIEQRKTDPKFTLIADAVHPGADGQVVMAFALLNDMHLNRQVSSIDAQRRGDKWVVKGARGTVSDISQEGDLAFTFAAESLPWVLPPEAALGYKLTKAGHKLSNERLRISGLAPGKYELKIDGQSAGVFTDRQLEFKIELQENSATPQHQQALQVALLNKERNDTAMRPLRNLWRDLKIGNRAVQQLSADPDNEQLQKRVAKFEKWKEGFKQKVAEAQALVEQFDERIYQANQPQPRRYELVKVE